MEANAPGGLLRWFDELQDPRPGHNVMHLLSDMLGVEPVEEGPNPQGGPTRVGSSARQSAPGLRPGALCQPLQQGFSRSTSSPG